MRTGHKQQQSHTLLALMHPLPVPAGSCLQPGQARGSAKSPQLTFRGWHPGSHPAAQRRLEGFTRFPHRAGSFARKSKFINSAFQHEQNESSRTQQSVRSGAECWALPSILPSRKDDPFPPSPSWPGPSSLSRKPGSGVCVRCAAWEHPCLAWQGSRAGFKKTRSRWNGQLLRAGARANTAHSSWLPSQAQGPQISIYSLKPSFHKHMGQKVSSFSSHPCRRQLPHG